MDTPPKRVTLVSAAEFTFTSVKKPEDILVCPDTLDALRKLRDGIVQNGGTFKINSLYRSWAKQQHLVDLHNMDVAMNKANPEHKIVNAYAAPPGGSYHQAGRAVDISLNDLHFPGLERKDWLSKLWEIYKPLGFTPIIKTPNIDESEAWHADFVGPWAQVKARFGNAVAAKCAIIDVGNWNPNTGKTTVLNMFVQAQLLRLGFDIGDVDGVIGMRSSTALKSLGVFSYSMDKIADILAKR